MAKSAILKLQMFFVSAFVVQNFLEDYLLKVHHRVNSPARFHFESSIHENPARIRIFLVCYQTMGGVHRQSRWCGSDERELCHHLFPQNVFVDIIWKVSAKIFLSHASKKHPLLLSNIIYVPSRKDLLF